MQNEPTDRVFRLKTGFLILALIASTLSAQPAPPAAPDPIPALQGRPDAQGAELLAGHYESEAAGIGFDTPANTVQVKPLGDEIARFVNEAKNWELIVARRSSTEPTPLADPKTKRGGLLDATAKQLKLNNPGSEIVRQDVVNIADADVGMLAARYSAGNQKKLIQQAIIQANDQLYYTLTLTTPGSKNAAADAQEDPGEAIAVETFKLMLDTVKLLDRSRIKEDQNERLFRTRALFVNISAARIKSAIVPEQWLRLLKDGKDIGYTYMVEELDQSGGNDGVKIGIRSRSTPDADTQVDGETWYFVSFDRKHETWSNLAWIQNKKAGTSDTLTEFGSSDRRISRVLDDSGKIATGDDKDPRQPPIRQTETYTLNVTTVGKTTTGQPLSQELPPFYLPQALGHLLPRLVPIREAKTYLFATWVGDRKAVMMRYVDVAPEQEVELNGQRMRAVAVSDRLGLEGSQTFHYISPDGKYLGSVNKDQKITILPSDATELQKLWANADLSRPKAPPQRTP